MLAQVRLETFEQEVVEILSHALGHDPIRELAAGALEQRAHVEPQRVLDQDAHHAERRAAQAEGILLAGGRQADTEDAGERIELVGQRHAHRDRAGRQLAAGSLGEIMLLDGAGHKRRLAIVRCIVAAHGALQLGEIHPPCR